MLKKRMIHNRFSLTKHGEKYPENGKSNEIFLVNKKLINPTVDFVEIYWKAEKVTFSCEVLERGESHRLTNSPHISNSTFGE